MCFAQCEAEMSTNSSKNWHLLLLPQLKRSSFPKKIPSISFWSCPFGFFFPSPFYGLLISISHFQSSKDIFWAQSTRVILPLTAVQMSVRLTMHTRSRWWLPNLPSLSCCSSAPKGLKLNHNKQRAQGKNTSFSDFPSITLIPPASQGKHSSTTMQDKYGAIGRGALH